MMQTGESSADDMLEYINLGVDIVALMLAAAAIIKFGY